VSKVIERVVASQLDSHMTANNLHEKLQSAYKKFHSTETALLKIQSDILMALDDHGAVLMVLLDLSAAFDTVDHEKLLQILEYRLGISGVSLKWFRSYLTGRTQTVKINGQSSSCHTLECGVPQGSVLGPILFTIYTLALGDSLRKHEIDYHLYADDKDLYICFKPSIPGDTVCTVFRIERCIGETRVWTKAHLLKTVCTVFRIERCIGETRVWTKAHLLKINDDKSDATLFRSKYQPKVDIDGIWVGEEYIKIQQSVRNLGVIFDQGMTGKDQVAAVCKASYYQTRKLGKIRRYLTSEAAVKVVHAFITSRLDYCNSLYYGLPSNLLDRLQRIQNTAARIVSRVKKFDHITPVLISLHWLPVEQRIKYKLLTIVYKARNGQAPAYIQDMIIPYEQSRSLRSKQHNLLVVPKTRQKSFGDRSFLMAAAVLWNALPDPVKDCQSIECFKKHLKTMLFKEAFHH
jgi:hypothetical protein